MVCYIIRHGRDDDSVRGGWSNIPLTAEGIAETEEIAEYMSDNLDIAHIFSSDIRRAAQTAEIISDYLMTDITYVIGFREVNNGKLAGMKNIEAEKTFPGLYWRTLGWEERYPDGESPREFFERVKCAWESFSEMMIADGENVLLVTHGGVINVILSLIRGEKYSNKMRMKSLAHNEILAVEYVNGRWNIKDRDLIE